MKKKLKETVNNKTDERSARKLSRRKRLLFIILPNAVFLLIILLVEAGVRLTQPHVTMLEAVVDSPQLRMGFTDRQSATIFESDPLLVWRLKPNLRQTVWDFTVVSTNSQGLRYEGEPGRKEEGALRIVCLGDSVTFGYRVPVVWPERPDDYSREWLPYPALLEKALRAANPGRKVEVIPLAVPGYTTHQGLAWLQRDIDRLRPDVVIACFGWNDANTSALTDRETLRTDFLPVLIRRLMTYSQAFTHAALFLKKSEGEEKQRSASPVTQRVPQEQYVENFIGMARATREARAKFVALAPVYRDRAANTPEGNLMGHYRASLREAMAREGFEYLEIRELTEENYPANESLFGEAIHPNHLGHRLLAMELLKHFAARDMLKGFNVPAELQP